MIELLTKRANELVDVIGLEATLKLVEHHGGTAIWIPKNPKPEHQYAVLLGFEAFKKLCAYYGDTAVEIDLCKSVLCEQRHQLIRADSEFLSNRELARKYRTTERSIRQILSKKARAKPKYQLDMFDMLLQ